jgi:hypothetical protein
MVIDSLNLDHLDQVENPDELIKALTAEKEHLLEQNSLKCSHASTASRKRALYADQQDIFARYNRTINQLRIFAQKLKKTE